MSVIEEFKSHFSGLIDPRQENHNHVHSADNILVLTLLAVIAGADSWTDVEDFGEDKLDELGAYIDISHGIPSHDTIGRFFSLLDPIQFQECFMSWISSLVTITDEDIIAIDGKRSCASHDKRLGKKAIHMISAFSCRHGLVLGQRKTHDKSNEITAIPELIERLDIDSAIITIDAMGCQKNIAEQIIEQGGDYVLAVKGNQGSLKSRLEECFLALDSDVDMAMVSAEYTEVDKGHGRVEKRKCTTMPVMYMLGTRINWPGLQSIARVQSERHIDGEIQKETRYYISSLKSNPRKIAHAVRSHWLIENQLHWMLDVTFNDDNCRVRAHNAAENFTVIKHLALNLLKMETTKKLGIAAKRKSAGRNFKYMDKVLQGIQNSVR